MPSRPSASAPSSATSVVLSWPGRSWTVGAHKALPIATVPIEQCGQSVGNDGKSHSAGLFEPAAARLPGRVIAGDALDIADALLQQGLGGSMDLIYLDPPFLSQANYVQETRLDGPADGRVTRTLAYGDRWGSGGVGEYLEMLAERLEAASNLLAPTGTLWLHLDWRAAYFARVLLDEILGRDRFLNEIVWRRAPNLGRQAASAQFGRTLDTILVYGGSKDARLVPPTRLEPIEKSAIRTDEAGRPFTSAPRGDYTDASIARLEAEGRIHRTASGRVYVKYFLVKDEEGAWCRERKVDTLWTDVPPLRHVRPEERTGFPTQKPRALLERIIRCATPEGGTVLDLFAGSGTTAEAAHVLGRRFIVGDAGPVALATMRARLLRAKACFTLERCGTVPVSVQDPCEIRVESKEDGREIDLRLLSPAEPLAWAVDTAYDASKPFACDWHSERTLGQKPVPAQTQAVIPRRGRVVGVRVYADDGSVGTLAHTVPS